MLGQFNIFDESQLPIRVVLNARFKTTEEREKAVKERVAAARIAYSGFVLFALVVGFS